MASPHIQDWETVTIKKTPKSVTGAGTASHTYVSKAQSTLANDFDPAHAAPKIQTSTRELGQAIQMARMAKKSASDPEKVMTQTELDNLCRFPKNTVRDYENGSAPIIGPQIDAMNRMLGVKLPRPPKPTKVAKDAK